MADVELYNINNLINDDPYSLQLMTSPGFFISLLMPMVENDKLLAEQISSKIETWNLSVANGSYLLLDGLNLKLDYSAIASASLRFNVDSTIVTQMLKGDGTYVSTSTYQGDDGFTKLKIELTDAIIPNSGMLSPIFGTYTDQGGYLYDKFISSQYLYSVSQSNNDGWGITKADAPSLVPVMPKQISSVSGDTLAFAVDTSTWKFHLTGGLLEKNRNAGVVGGVADEYQALYSFFWNDNQTFPQAPIWLQFYENRSGLKHSLLGQFDNTIMGKITSSMMLYPDDFVYEHYLDRIDQLTTTEYGRIPIVAERNRTYYELMTAPSTTIQSQSEKPMFASSTSNAGVPANINGKEIMFESQYDVVNVRTLKRESNDWIVDSTLVNGTLVSGRIFNRDTTSYRLESIIGISLPQWLKNRISLKLSHESGKTIVVKGDEMKSFVLELVGVWTFTLENANA